MANHNFVATLTKTLKLPFLRLNQAKAAKFARLQELNTKVANSILALPKEKRRALTSKSFTDIEIGSGWITQTIRNANARTKVKQFKRLPLETNNQNWSLHRVGDTFSVSFGLLRGIKKRIPLEVHAASHREWLLALLEGRAKKGSLKLVRSKKGIWYACLSASMEVPEARDPGRWIGIDRGQNVPVVASTPDGLVIFWQAAKIRHIRRRYAERRRILQKAGKLWAVKKIESKERRIVTYINHCISKQLVALAKRENAGLLLEDLSGIRARSRQRKKSKSDAGQNRNYWPFYQIEQFIRYKALAAGVKVALVPAHYTPKTCHRCGALNERKKQAYVCIRCGYKAHADANAAMNIRDWYGLCCPVVLEARPGGPHDPALKRVSQAAAYAAAQRKPQPLRTRTGIPVPQGGEEVNDASASSQG